jgi:hypothetical protein
MQTTHSSLPKREPIELAVIGFLRPHLLDAEAEFIQKNAFQLTYLPFDWRLNDSDERTARLAAPGSTLGSAAGAAKPPS